jgi:diphthamide synthase (EF-2-diphthine--ammonia ligase)
MSTLTQSCLEARFPNVQGVASGAILSDYQRFRVENVYVHLF